MKLILFWAIAIPDIDADSEGMKRTSMGPDEEELLSAELTEGRDQISQGESFTEPSSVASSTSTDSCKLAKYCMYRIKNLCISHKTRQRTQQDKCCCLFNWIAFKFLGNWEIQILHDSGMTMRLHASIVTVYNWKYIPLAGMQLSSYTAERLLKRMYDFHSTTTTLCWSGHGHVCQIQFDFNCLSSVFTVFVRVSFFSNQKIQWG